MVHMYYLLLGQNSCSLKFQSGIFPIFVTYIVHLFQIPVACIPVPYRTSADAPGMQLLKDQDTGLCSFTMSDSKREIKNTFLMFTVVKYVSVM